MMFTFSDFSGFEEQFPDTVAEICHNVYVVRKLLEYNCMLTDPNVLTDPLDKCRYTQ